MADSDNCNYLNGGYYDELSLGCKWGTVGGKLCSIYKQYTVDARTGLPGDLFNRLRMKNLPSGIRRELDERTMEAGGSTVYLKLLWISIMKGTRYVATWWRLTGFIFMQNENKFLDFEDLKFDVDAPSIYCREFCWLGRFHNLHRSVYPTFRLWAWRASWRPQAKAIQNFSEKTRWTYVFTK